MNEEQVIQNEVEGFVNNQEPFTIFRKKSGFNPSTCQTVNINATTTKISGDV